MSPHPPLRFSQALARGFALASKSPRVVALGLAAQLSSDLLSAAIAVAFAGVVLSRLGFLEAPLLAALAPGDVAPLAREGSFDALPVLPLAGAGLVAALLALALRLLWFAAAARTAAERFEGRAAPGVLDAAAARLDRALPLLALLAPLGAAVLLYDGAALGATWLAFARAQALRALALGVASAAGLALASVVAFLLLCGFGLFAKLALVVALAGDRGPLASLRRGARLFGERLGTLVALEVAFGALQVAPRLVSTWGLALAFGVGAGAESLALGALVGVLASLAASALAIFFATAEVGALAAVEADSCGLLAPPPLPPSAAPVLATELVAPTETV